jgi:hypothetical protein
MSEMRDGTRREKTPNEKERQPEAIIKNQKKKYGSEIN